MGTELKKMGLRDRAKIALSQFLGPEPQTARAVGAACGVGERAIHQRIYRARQKARQAGIAIPAKPRGKHRIFAKSLSAVVCAV